MALIGTVAVQSFHQCARLSCDLPVNTIRELRLLIGAQSLQSVLNGAGSTRTVEIENTVQRFERLAYEERTPQKATTKDSKDGTQVGSTLCTFINLYCSKFSPVMWDGKNGTPPALPK